MAITLEALKTFTRTGPARPQFVQQLTPPTRLTFRRDCYIEPDDGGNRPLPLVHPEAWSSAVIATNAEGLMMVEFPHPEGYTCSHPNQFIGLYHRGALHLFETVPAAPSMALHNALIDGTFTPTLARIPSLPTGYLWGWSTHQSHMPDDFVTFTCAPFTRHLGKFAQSAVAGARYYVLRNQPSTLGFFLNHWGSLYRTAIPLTAIGFCTSVVYEQQLLFFGALAAWGIASVFAKHLDRIPIPFRGGIDIPTATNQIRAILNRRGDAMLMPELIETVRTRFANDNRRCDTATVERATDTMIDAGELYLDTRQYLAPTQQLVEVPHVGFCDPPRGGNGRGGHRRRVTALHPDLAPIPSPVQL